MLQDLDLSGVTAEGGDDFGEVVGNGDGGIGQFAGGFGTWRFGLNGFDVDAGVVFDGSIGIFELVAGKNADDIIIG